MSLRRMRAHFEAALRRECRRLADMVWAVSLGAQGDEKLIRQTLMKLRRAAGGNQPAEENRLVILTDG